MCALGTEGGPVKKNSLGNFTAGVRLGHGGPCPNEKLEDTASLTGKGR